MGDDLVKIVLEFRDGCDAGVELLPVQYRLERTEDRERPVAQRLAFALRNAEHVADERDWNCRCKVGDQIDFTARGGGIQAADRPGFRSALAKPAALAA